MFKYEYVTIVHESVLGYSKFGEHREIINEYAEKGYKYAGFVPVKSDDRGKLIKIDLIFEKQE